MKNFYCDVNVTKSTASGKAIEIEGFANKNIVDRGNDRVDPFGIKLENFNANPIMLFNHNPDMPIGKITEIKAMEEGLKVRGQLSRANEGPVKFVREMIADGTLKTFSIGFNVDDEEQDEKGVNQIKSGELLEVSVVSVPMNQASTFEVVNKALDSKNFLEARCKILESKGASDVATIHRALDSKVEEGHYRKSLLSHVCDESGVSEEDMEKILAGNIALKNEVIEASNHILGTDIDLKEMEEKPKEDEDEESPKQEEGDESDDPKNEESFRQCVNEKVPKLIEEGKSRDEAIATAISMCEGEKCEISDERKQAIAQEIKMPGEVQGSESNDMQLALRQSNITLSAAVSELQAIKNLLSEFLNTMAMPKPEDEEEEMGGKKPPEESTEEEENPKSQMPMGDDEDESDEEEKSSDEEDDDREEEEAFKKIEVSLEKLVELGHVSDIDLNDTMYAGISNELRAKIKSAQELDTINKSIDDLYSRVNDKFGI